MARKRQFSNFEHLCLYRKRFFYKSCLVLRKDIYKEIVMENLVGQIIFGLIVGVIAKFLMPGRDPGGFIITAIIGMVGSVIGAFLGRALWGGAGYESGWIAAILGSIILLAGYRLLTRGQVTA
jgi:uncharacterized membrane protein YeaQ/YmgE (transglycosylase-associated protein family)